MNKRLKNSYKQERPKTQLDQRQINKILGSLTAHSDNQNNFLESFCHKYSNLNSSVEGCFSERMRADIEKRAKKAEELERAENLFNSLHQKPIGKEEKEECHTRLYLDAFSRAYKRTEQIAQTEQEEMSMYRKKNRTASK